MADPPGAEPLRSALSGAWLRGWLARQPPSRRYWIAYSGGLDSLVLLRLCAEARAGSEPPEFTAVHVHHGLQAAAEGWAEHCRATCLALGMPFRLLRVDARPKPGQSPEEAARAARYGALRSLLGPGDGLLTAQHRDDQAETLLLQLLRGAGLAGLAAMPEAASFGHGRLLRPLLDRARGELRDFAEARGLAWVEDPSNRDPAYDRNFLRHRIMPLLTERWPAAPATLARAAGHCAEAQDSLAALARDLLATARNPDGASLSVAHLRRFCDKDRRLVLREWLKTEGYRSPSARVLERAAGEALSAGGDRNPAIRWPEGQIRRYRDGLYLLPPAAPFDGGVVLPWDGSSALRLPDGNGELVADRVDGAGIDPAIWAAGAVTVGYRRGGERLRLPGRAGSHALKNLFQETGVPPWVRERTPLIYLDGRLAAVAGRWVAAECLGGKDGRQIAIRWNPPGWLIGSGGALGIEATLDGAGIVA